MLADLIPKVAAETQGPQARYRPRPSSAGPERCIRSMVYHALDVPKKPLPGRALLIFDDSNFHEVLTSDWIGKTAFRLHSEQMDFTIPNVLGWETGTYKCWVCNKQIERSSMHGHIDGILTDILGVDRYYEHKAINHFTFEHIWKGAWPVDYIAQIVIGLYGIKQIVPGLKEAILLIKNKNTSQYIEILMRVDVEEDTVALLEVVRSDGQRYVPTVQDENGVMVPVVFENVFAAAIEKFYEVEKYRSSISVIFKTIDIEEPGFLTDFNGMMPKRPYDLGEEFPCSYCGWNQVCWATYKEEHEKKEKALILGPEIEKLAAAYLLEAATAAEANKNKKDIQDQIKTHLSELNAKEGKAGKFNIDLQLQSRDYIDEELLPPDAAAAAKYTTDFEVLKVTKTKEKK